MKRERAEQAGADIHEQIAMEAAQARSRRPGFAEDGYPALTALLQAARSEIARSTPKEIQFHGRTYWCRVSHGMMHLQVFDSPATAKPVVETICGSSDHHGHQPAH
jgi:hypothetical protein